MTQDAIETLKCKGRLIFLNTCEGATTTTEDPETGLASSLAEAFKPDIEFRVVISPIYPVVNIQAARFAETFFGKVCNERMNYIQGLREARAESWELYDSGDPDTAWLLASTPSVTDIPPDPGPPKENGSPQKTGEIEPITKGKISKTIKIGCSLTISLLVVVLIVRIVVGYLVCPSREIMGDICPCVMEQNASNAFVDTYLGSHEPLVEPLPTYFLSSQSPSDATSATIQGVSLQLPPSNLRERAKAFHYVSEIRKRKDHWGMVLFWAAGRKYPFLPRSLSAEGEQHLLLTIYSSVDETIRIGFKDVTQNEKKVSLPLKQGWATYIVPLSYFEPVDLNRFTLFSLAHEEKYANHEEIQLEVLNISFDTLEIPKI
jgi:hypothetical protein